MPNWTIIARTGDNVGQAYNGLGTNLTESPDGARNRFVGSYDLDFAGLTARVLAVGLSNTQAGIELYTPELTFVIADGRRMIPSENDDEQVDDTSDPDEVDPSHDASMLAASSVVIPGRRCTLTGVHARVQVTHPTYSDASVYQTKTGGLTEDLAATNSILDVVFDTLPSTLDAIATDTLGEGSGDADLWWIFRNNLRFNLHWALYVVKLVPPSGGEGVSDDLKQFLLDDDLPFAPDGTFGPDSLDDWQPSEGPAGYMATFGEADLADAANSLEWFESPWIRLWEHNPPGSRLLRRGSITLPFAVHGGTNFINAWQYYDVDIVEDPPTVNASGTQQESADVHAHGNMLNLNIRWRGEHRLRADEIVLLHIQTSRVRLQAPGEDLLGIATPGFIIGSLSTQLPTCGPQFTLAHFTVRARSRTT